MDNISNIAKASSSGDIKSSVKFEPNSMKSGKGNILKDSSNTKKSKNMTSPLKTSKKHRVGEGDILRVKRKLGNLTKIGLNVQTRNPATMAKRNARERRRVQNINHTLDNLEKILPEYYVDKKDKNKKLSKLEVLRATIDYIQTLQIVLNDDTKNNNLLMDAQMLQSFLPMHMQQMDMHNQYLGHHQTPAPMDVPHMQYQQTPASDNWGIMSPAPVMHQAPATPLYQPQYEPMPVQQHTTWNIHNIL